MIRGKLRWFNDTKGYGFIQREDGTDVFMHFTAIQGKGLRTMKEGDQVEFEVSDGPKGPFAVKVQKVS